jgi:hypothetical protein
MRFLRSKISSIMTFCLKSVGDMVEDSVSVPLNTNFLG